jgi:GT2 family glycosyltransferase
MTPENPSSLYDAYYYEHGCGSQPYQRNPGWLQVFGAFAEHIARDIHPASVLDAGCAMGFLVETLRLRGIEAWGIDISEYAISNVHPDIQPYCKIGSVTEPPPDSFPQRYDLIVCIEILEHLEPRQAEQAVANLCQHAEDILFSSTPFDHREVSHINVQPPEYWAELFARHGFFRDLDFDASFITPWAARFRKTNAPSNRVVLGYERRLFRLEQENIARRELGLEQRGELSAKEFEIQGLVDRAAQLDEILHSRSWQTVQKIQAWRRRLLPENSRRERAAFAIYRMLAVWKREGLRGVMSRIRQRISLKGRTAYARTRFRLSGKASSQVIQVAEVSVPRQVSPPGSALADHPAGSTDIVICVHNALQDVQRCLESILVNTHTAYHLILVDDGSAPETQEYLAAFTAKNNCTLLRNEQARGYTYAANQGLHQSSSDFVMLLNSDVIVTPAWLDRLLACALSDAKIGIVGPLSNTASWQSIPEISSNGDWAENPLPAGVSVDDAGRWVARYSGQLYPRMTLLNGFCLMIRRQVIDTIGYLDEENFGAGYGEENDYCLRARKAGWELALADDTYLYHAQSRSYSHERRQMLSENAAANLARKYSQVAIDEAVAYCLQNRVLQGIRARSRQMAARQRWVEKGKAAFAGRRVLFILPTQVAGGGANVIVTEASAMLEMGVDVQIFNFRAHRSDFEQAYPGLVIPVIYGEIADMPGVTARFDAVIATFNPSVAWMASGAAITDDGAATPAYKSKPVYGYYIQDFEPLFYPVGSDGYRQAWESYTLIPNLVRFAKTEWTRLQVEREIQASCSVVGASFDSDLFYPRPRTAPEWPNRPLRIGAMIRPNSSRREPALTMEILQQAYQHYGNQLEFMLFGTAPDDPGFAALSHVERFPWRLAGILNPRQVANFLNEVDIFVDYSSYQAMGLTALEAMACGAAVIVPQNGGSDSFARHEQNCLFIDTSNRQSCWENLQRLIDDHPLRARLEATAMLDTPQYFPELPAFNILNLLFRPKPVTR